MCDHVGHNDSLETTASVSQNSNDQADEAKFQRINYLYFFSFGVFEFLNQLIVTQTSAMFAN